MDLQKPRGNLNDESGYHYTPGLSLYILLAFVLLDLLQLLFRLSVPLLYCIHCNVNGGVAVRC